jgi:MFS family permease
VLLSLASFLNDVRSEIILPILPMFIISLGGAGIAIGLIGGIRDSIASIFKIFSGYISDKTGQKKIFVFYGYLFSSIVKIFLAFARSWQNIFFLIGIERVGKGLRDAPRDAIIAQAMPNNKGKGFGFHRAFDSAGAILGSILAFILFWFLNFSFQTIIIISAAIAFLSVIPIYLVKETKSEKKDLKLKISLFNLPKKLKFFLIIVAIFAMANFSYMFFILQAQSLFTSTNITSGSKFTKGIPILLYILFNIFYAGLAIPFGKLSDKIGRKKVLLLGYTIFAITATGFAFLQSITSYIILFAFYGTANAIINSNQRAFVSDLSEEKMQGTSLGAYYTITGLVALPASIIAGIIWKFWPQGTFIYCATLSYAAAIILLTMRKKL